LLQALFVAGLSRETSLICAAEGACAVTASLHVGCAGTMAGTMKTEIMAITSHVRLRI